MCEQIVNKYISEISLKQVNLPSSIRKGVQNAFVESQFDRLVNHQLIKNDFHDDLLFILYLI